MLTKAFFFDTYAFIEIFEKSENYEKYLSFEPITCDITLGELYYVMLRDKDEKTAEVWFNKIKPFSLPVDIETIKSAMFMKKRYVKRKMSMVDCIGYVKALSFGLKFLTGDDQFKDLPNVEFVK